MHFSDYVKNSFYKYFSTKRIKMIELFDNQTLISNMIECIKICTLSHLCSMNITYEKMFE